MAKILTEQEVAAVGQNGASYTSNLCCTAGRASALNCVVTSPSGAANNQLITGVQKGGPVANGHYFWFTGTTPAEISNTGGTSAVPTITECRWYTTYDNGTESYTTMSSSSVTWAYGKISVGGSYSQSNPPAYTAASYSSSSSNCQFTASTNSSGSKLLGWAFVRGIYSGSTDYMRREVWQAGKSATGHSLSVYTDPLPSIDGAGGTSNALTVTVTYYTTYSDGTTGSSNVTSSSTIQYNTTYTDSQPSSWYNGSSYGRITAEQNPYTTSRVVGYAWAKATYNGYTGYDRSTVSQSGYTPSGPTITGYDLEVITDSLPYIPGSGGTSNVPGFSVTYTINYSNGTSSESDVKNSATIKYGKNDSRSEPSTWSTSSSGCQYSVGANSKNERVTIGYAFVKAWFNGLEDSDSSKVSQEAYSGSTPSRSCYLHWDTSNCAGKTTPVIYFHTASGSSSVWSSGRYGGTGSTSGDADISWSSGQTITRVKFQENASNIKKFMIRSYNGQVIINKTTITTGTYITLTNSFSTSDYNNGTYKIYVYYYDS